MAQPNDSSDTKPLPEAKPRFIGETLNCRGQTADGLRRIPRRSARTAEQPDAKRHCPEGAGDDGGHQTLGVSTTTSSNMSYTIDVYNVPVHYTPGDMEELLEASGIEAPWFESAQFLKPLADDPEFCAVLLRYSDEQSAQVTTRHLDGQDVASESGKARRLGVKFNRVQVSSSIPEDQLQDNAGSHMTDIPSDNDDALHEEPTKVESVSPHALEEFCERWGFKHLTNLWIASLPVGVQSGIINKYDPNDECSEEDHEDPSSFLLTGLPADADENIVKALLFVYGVVKSCRMQPGGASCASATVIMESIEDARAAAEGLNGMTLDGSETPLTASLQDADALQTKRMEKDSRRLAALESLAGSLQAAERHSAFGFLDRLARQQASKAGEASSASGNKKFTLERRRRQAEAAATAEAPRIIVPPGKQKIIVPPLRRPRIIEPPCKSDPNGKHPTNLGAFADGRALPLPPPPHDPRGYHEAQPLPHAPPPLPVWQPLLPHPLPPPPGRGAPPAGWGAPPPGWGAPPPGWGAPPPGCFSPPPGSVGYNPYAPPPVGRLPGPPAPGPPAPGPPAPGPPAYPKLAYGSIERNNVQVGKAKPPAHPPPAHLRR